MDIEIENTERCDFFDLLATHISDEKLPKANFDEANHGIRLFVYAQI